MRNIPWFKLLITTCAVFAAQSLQADDREKTGVLSFTLENDLFYGNDRHYTGGVRFIWAPDPSNKAPGWLLKLARVAPWFPQQGEARVGYGFGQSLFSPSDITIENPPLNERPYAGWLYGGIGLGISSGRQLDLFSISVGIVGPDALGEEAQSSVHELVGADEPQGWDTQLKNELGILVTYQQLWRGTETSTYSGRQMDLSPHMGIVLGNVFSYVNTGFTVRYGNRLPDDYGPPRIQPGLPGTPVYVHSGDFSWYLFAGLETRVVARNIFLDGNLIQDSRSVEKEILVGDLQFGVVFDWTDFRLSYAHVIRSREFEAQEEVDQYGGIGLTYRF